ncbi:MAG: hypothetical protein IJ040_01540 [Lachnospiraceae bacterium]|nr:hypothetical protein [Lachnospiraceae bacterium]
MSGKTPYTLEVNDPQKANMIIQDWLKSHGFVYEEKDNEKFYRVGDGIFTAKRYFQYGFDGNRLVIYVFWKSHKKPQPVKVQFYGGAILSIYLGEIEKLLFALEENVMAKRL